MSEQINKCVECGGIFIGNTPKYWFQCSTCGKIYIQRIETGLWYEEDDYHDQFDAIDEFNEIQELKE